MSTEITLRTQPTCPHCLKDDGYSAILRYVTMNGYRAECAGCGMELGDAKELTIPTNVTSIYETLIKRGAMRIRYFNSGLPMTEVAADQSFFPVTLDQISFASRAAHNHSVQCILDWFAFDATEHQPRPVTPAFTDMDLRSGALERQIKTFPPAVALAAQVFINDGFVVIELPREGATEGTMRFRKVQSVTIKTGPRATIKLDDDVLLDAGTGKEWDEHTVIRAQLSW